MAKQTRRYAGDQHERIALAGRVGSNIRGLRRAQELEASDLARISGVSRTMIVRTESGGTPPSLHVVHSIARALGVSLDQITEERKDNA